MKVFGGTALCIASVWAYPSSRSRALRPKHLSSDLTDDPDISRVLQEQGVSIDELMGLRRALMEGDSPDSSSYRRARVSVKKRSVKKSEGEGTEVMPFPRQTQSKIHTRLSPEPNSEPASPRIKSKKPADAVETAKSVKPPETKSRPIAVKVTAPVLNMSADSEDHGATTRRSDLRERPRRLEIDMTGVTLQQQLEFLVDALGFEALFEETGMRCFANSPSVKSSLKALRSPSAEWARKKIEFLYIRQKKQRDF